MAVCCLLCAGVLSTGCVQRSLTIRTDPPGAQVFLNDGWKGESPVTLDFQWYGWHRVTIKQEGYERIEDRRRLRAPAHLWIPFDLIAELLPVTVRDERAWSYTLTPAVVLPTPTPPAEFGPDPEAVSQDAEAGAPEPAPTEPQP